MSRARIVIEMELTPETIADGVGRRYLKATIEGSLRGSAGPTAQTPTAIVALAGAKTYVGELIAIMQSAAVTNRPYGWLMSDDGCNNATPLTAGVVYLEGHGVMEMAEQQTGLPDMGNPTGWFPEGMRGLLLSSAPIDDVHRYSMWFDGNSTLLKAALIELDDPKVTVEVV
jgi:hypothetical protein